MKKQQILDVANDLANAFIYYDRKEDEDLPVGEIEKAIKDGDVTVDEIVQQFKDSLMEGLKSNG